MQRFILQALAVFLIVFLAGCADEYSPTSWQFKAGRKYYYDVTHDVKQRSSATPDEYLHTKETGYLQIACKSGDKADLTLSLKDQDSDKKPKEISLGYASNGEVLVENAAIKSALQTMFDIWFPLLQKELAVNESCIKPIQIELGNSGAVSKGAITARLAGYTTIQGMKCAIIVTTFELAAKMKDEKAGEVMRQTKGEGVAHYAVNKGCFYRSEVVSTITFSGRARTADNDSEGKKPQESAEIRQTQEEHTIIKLAP
ncbi:MAG: hypothetical protein ACYS8W_07300 [Planctomycetota bacterium]|jgi:hypothetical protein